jgi:hypothetical protein
LVRTVWYRWTAPATEVVRVTVQPAAGGDDSGASGRRRADGVRAVSAGTRYWVQVGEKDQGTPTGGAVSGSIATGVAPANDDAGPRPSW